MRWDYVSDWAAFLLRWLHVIAAIVWIGTSFYFVALDKHLRPARRDDERLAGDTWEIHGGGFYRVEKYRVAPDELPEPLHWFKWEAYTTWIAGSRCSSSSTTSTRTRTSSTRACGHQLGRGDRDQPRAARGRLPGLRGVLPAARPATSCGSRPR